MKNITYTILICTLFSLVSNAQVGINTTTPDSSSMLDITSADKGVLVPRISLTSTTDVATVVSPATSLLIYNTATIADVVPGYYYWNGTAWAQFATGKDANKWDVAGNSGTNDAVNFIGTTDDQDVVFKRNNSIAGRLSDEETSLGLNSLSSNTTGANNTALGINTLSLSVISTGNTAVGANALQNHVGIGFLPDSKNTAIGENSLQSNTRGFLNTAVGANSLIANLGGTNNVSIGAFSLSNNTEGDSNVAIGRSALLKNIDGRSNIAIGEGALSNNTLADRNIAIGFGSLSSTVGGNSGENNIGIGFSAQVPDSDLDDQVRIGNTNVTYAGVEVAWSITSDARKKNTITNTNLGLNFINLIRPVSYFKNNDKRNRLEYGFIAQELEAALKTAGVTNSGMLTVDTEGMYSVRYNDLLAPIVKAIQEQAVSIETLKKENEVMAKELQEIKTLLLNKK